VNWIYNLALAGEEIGHLELFEKPGFGLEVAENIE
jgi:hypothetical protein